MFSNHLSQPGLGLAARNIVLRGACVLSQLPLGQIPPTLILLSLAWQTCPKVMTTAYPLHKTPLSSDTPKTEILRALLLLMY